VEKLLEEKRIESAAAQEMRREQSRPEPAPSARGEATPAEPAHEEKRGVTAAPLPGAPRGTIRGRWGTRGRYRPSAAPPPIFDGQKPGRGERERPQEPEPPADPEPFTEPVGLGQPDDVFSAVKARLRKYSGVGDRTADTLIEAFGSDLFRVMDEEPDRIRAILPDHRAERVLEARRREAEARGE
jgi:hypothetical protein